MTDAAHSTTTETQTMAKRDCVRRFLIEPMERDGMVRDPKSTVAAHEAFLAKVVDRLAYMSAANLERLRVNLMRLAGGPAKNVWPGWATVRNLAYDFQTPPDPQNPIMQTWLHSVEGPRLREQGLHVEAYLYLAEKAMPLTPGALFSIKRRAEENNRRRDLALRRAKKGRLDVDEQRWLEHYMRLIRTVDDIVDAGIAHRADQAKNGEAA